MKVEQIYTGCLAHAAYYIENNGEVAIIDPLREVQPYINRAKLDDAKIKLLLYQKVGSLLILGLQKTLKFLVIV